MRVTIKEFLVILRDRLSIGQLIVVPIVMLFVFSFALTMEVKGKTLGVMNEDEGDLGAMFVRMFEPGETYSEIVTISSMEELYRAVDTQRILMALRIPRDFTARLSSGRRVAVQTILDGRKSNAAQIASGYASLIAAEFARQLYANRTASAAVPVIETRALFNPNVEFSWFNQPTLLVILTQMLVLLITGLSVSKERELGTFEQLLVSPLSPLEIVAGKIVPGIVLGLAEGAFMFSMATFIFRVPFVGDLWLLAAVMLMFIIAISAVGLSISSFCYTQQQAFLGNCLFIVPSTLLSGLVSPIENMPASLQTFTLINPTRHTMKAVMDVYLKNASLSDISYEMWWLTGISVVLLAVAAISFKSRTQ